MWFQIEKKQHHSDWRGLYMLMIFSWDHDGIYNVFFFFRVGNFPGKIDTTVAVRTPILFRSKISMNYRTQMEYSK